MTTTHERPTRFAGTTADRDARRRAEAELRASERRFVLAVTGADVGIWEWDLTGDQAYFSPRCQELFGRPSDGVDTRPKSEWAQWFRYHPDDVAPREAAIRDHLEGRTPYYEGEWRVLHPDGTYHWIYGRGICERDESGRAVRFAGSTADIDAKKRSEAALRESESRFALAVAGANDGIWERDLVNDRVYFSPRAQELLGLAPGGPSVLSHAEWRKLLRFHPDDVATREAALRDHLQGRTPHYEGEWRVLQPDGSYRWIHSRGLCTRDETGRAVRFAGSMTDIDAQKRMAEALRRSEERYAIVMAATGEGYWDWIIPTDEFYASPRMLEMYGLPPDSTFATRAEFVARIPMHPEDLPQWERAVAAHFAGGTARFELEVRMLPRGELRWVRLVGRCSRDASGAVVRWSGSVSDVTDRRRAEAALRESEERFALAVAGAKDGIWDRDLVNDRVYYSPRALELLGQPAFGARGGLHEESESRFGLHPDDVASRAALIEDHLRGATPHYEGDWRYLQPDGTYRWIRTRGVCTRDATGRPVRFAGSVSDIDAERRMADALRRAEERHALILEATGEGYWDWIIATDDFQQSPRLMGMYGFDAGTTFTGRADFLTHFPFHPEDRPKWDRAVAAHFAGTDPRLEMEIRIVPRGELRWLRLTGVCQRDASGAPVRWVGAVADVTERRRAEEALRLSEDRYARAMEGSDAGHWDWDVVTDEMFVSTHARELLALTAEPLPAHRTAIMALVPMHPEDRLDMARVTAASLVSGIHEREYRVIPRPGEIRWVRARAKVFLDERGAPARMTGSVTDVTEAKRVADELRARQEQLRQSQRLEDAGTLAGGIAHDFNNILGAILGYGEMALRDAAKGSRLRRDLDSIMTAGERGRALVERILAFSRSGVGERFAVHVEAVAREALDHLAARLPGGVGIEPRLRAGRAAVLGDPTQVHQVLMNLATNAVQAMPAGGTLRVSLEPARLDAPRVATTGEVDPGDYLVLEVADDGIGIAPEIVERIFDPFFTTKEVGVGTGLGLSLVHGIVTELGGAIDVASSVGTGSVFTVYLPRTGDAADDDERDAPATPRGDRQQILVVDDEEPLVRLATETLADLGYAPVGFASSAAALAAFRADPDRFDAVLTDERMPGISGSALIRKLREIRREIPILLVSGYLGATVVQRARDAGADEVLKKPLLAHDLATSLARALHRRQKPASGAT